MRRTLLSLAGLVVAAGLVLPGTPAVASGPACPNWGATYEPPDGKTILLAGQDRDSIDAYSAGTGIDPGGVVLYTNIGTPLLGTVVPFDIGSGWHDMQHMLSRYPHAVVQIGMDMKLQEEAVALGAHDANIVALAAVLQQAKRPVYLRIGYEFDGAHNDYDPTAYQQAYRRVVQLMRGAGTTNVSFVWHATGSGGDLMPWYPGRCYVDWVGVSIFKQAFAGLAGPNRVADTAAALQHPLMIAESTPRGVKTPNADAAALWDDWYVPVTTFVAQRNVKAWSYINANWDAQSMWAGKGWGDTRVENPALLSLWKTEISTSRYLHSSPTLFSTLGHP